MTITSSIIPASCMDADICIISFLDNNSVVMLSGVNKCAYFTLSNLFFEKLFNAQHPSLARYKNIYTSLKNFYPNYCWKVIVCVSSRPTLAIPPSALKEALPVILNSLSTRKSQREIELKQICGSGYQDPNSPIHIAWVAFSEAIQEQENNASLIKEQYLAAQQAARELDDWSLARGPAMDKLLLEIHSAVDLLYICKLISKNRDRILNEGINHFTDEELHPLIKCHFPIYRSVAEYMSELVKKLTEIDILHKKCKEPSNKSAQLRKEYLTLERTRVEYTRILSVLNDILDDFNRPFEKCNGAGLPLYLDGSTASNFSWTISSEFWEPINTDHKDANAIEAIFSLLPNLDECLTLIQKIVNKEQEATPEALESIASFINSCCNRSYLTFDEGKTVREAIWQRLYAQCANGAIPKDDWAETHFSEFLPELASIIKIITAEAKTDLNSFHDKL